VRAWQLLRVAFGGIRRTPLRLALTSLGVAIATGSLISMVAFALGLQGKLEEPFLKLEMFNRVEVTAREGGPPLDDAALVRLRQLPGVVTAFPPLMRAGIEIARGSARRSALVQGLPADVAALPPMRALLVAGEPFAAGETDAILLSERLARELGFPTPRQAVGATVTLSAFGLAPVGAGQFAYRNESGTFRVVGVTRAAWEGRLPTFAVVPWDRMRTLPGVEVTEMLSGGRNLPARRPGTFARVEVRVARPADLGPVEDRVRRLGFATATLLDQARQFRTAFLVLDLLLAAVGTVALVVAGLGIVNTLLMAVLERTAEIGTYKALGASTGDVRLLFLFEAALVGLIGGAGGVALGRGVSALIGLGIDQVARSRGVEGAIALFSFPPWLVLGAVAFAVLASLVSGAYPAARAARVDPIRALRGL
jgi:putative ABC transport system permease protein